MRDVPRSLGLSLGRGQPALGMRPLQVAADPKSLSSACPASTSGVDIKYTKEHLLVRLCASPPGRRRPDFSTQAV